MLFAAGQTILPSCSERTSKPFLPVRDIHQPGMASTIHMHKKGPSGSCTNERKNVTMSDQFENESMTPEEVRQSLLAEIDATQQAIAELSNEQLEEVVGGKGIIDFIKRCLGCGGGKQPVPESSLHDESHKPDPVYQPPTPGRRNLDRMASQIPESVRRAMSDWGETYSPRSTGGTPRR
jgi:hypothetical protein